MATLQQLRAKTYLEISQTEGSSDISNSEIDGFLNEAMRFIAVIVGWPKDIVDIQAEEDKSTYTLLSDTLKIDIAYFGDRGISGDMRKLKPITESALPELDPGWLENTTESQGEPIYIVLIDRRSVLIHPRPNASNSASGKKIYLSYVYNPATMNTDADEPDLPLSYHDLLPIFAAHKAYGGKLKNPELAVLKYKEFRDKEIQLRPKVDQDIGPMYWAWGSDIESSSESTVSNLRLN